jgi:flagellar assembly protein FliH
LLPKKRIRNENILPFCMPLLRMKAGTSYAPSGPEADNAEHIERDAYEKGFEAGEKAGFEMGETKAQTLIEKLDNLVSELAGIRKKIVREIEPQIIELAMSVARKIILKELEMNPDLIVEITKEALVRLERMGQITIKITASLYELFMKHKPDMLNIHPDIVFDIDPSAPAYGAILMGTVEDIITDIDAQMKNLIKEMGERVNGD